MLKATSLFILFVIFSLHSFSQNDIGLYPPSVKWKQIIVPSGKVIFPEGLDSLAFRTAALMNYERIHDSSLVKSGETKHVPVILQNLSTLPAGFSTPAPWRSEYSMTPPQNLFLAQPLISIASPFTSIDTQNNFTWQIRGSRFLIKF